MTYFLRYIKAPKELQLSSVPEKKAKNPEAEEIAAFGTYASGGGQKFVYRVKKPGAFGGYKIVSEVRL